MYPFCPSHEQIIFTKELYLTTMKEITININKKGAEKIPEADEVDRVVVSEGGFCLVVPAGPVSCVTGKGV